MGPATVAMAVPLLRKRREVRRARVPMAGALLAGSLTGIVPALTLARMAGARSAILARTAVLVPWSGAGSAPEPAQPRKALRSGALCCVAGSMAWTSWQ
ncbi:MAG: LrgB family protein [Phreatobacter sp.]|nr:LrgB family protein [Phreatobacter sp.]